MHVLAHELEEVCARALHGSDVSHINIRIVDPIQELRTTEVVPCVLHWELHSRLHESWYMYKSYQDLT